MDEEKRSSPMKYIFVFFLVGFVIALAVSGISSLVNANPKRRLEEAVGGINVTLSDKAKSDINKGIEAGKADAAYDYAMHIYDGDPVEVLGYLEDEYLEDGVLDDSEYAHMKEVTEQISDLASGGN